MSKPNILLQLDTDTQASVFDSIVAVDSDVDHLLVHSGVTPNEVRDLVHGTMFTRGPEKLRHTAIFIGGSDVADGQELLKEVTKCFFGPMRVSVMVDPGGSNTTAVAAVLVASKHAKLEGAETLVLAATGPVGSTVAELLAREGASVRVASRTLQRAQDLCDAIQSKVQDAQVFAHETSSPEGLKEATDGVQILFAAGTTGVELLSAEARQACSTLRMAIDLNAVPPSGLEGVEIVDEAAERDGAICYGAIGVGSTKMKIHKAAIRRLFEQNDQILDAQQIYDIGLELQT